MGMTMGVMGIGGGRLAGEDVDGAVAEWGCAMKFVAVVLASGIFVLGVLGCGGGPQVEERPEARPTPSLVPTVEATAVPTATVVATMVPTGPQLSIAVAPVTENIPDYDRGEWRHWVDEDGDCQDARQEALIAESETPVTYKSEDRCRVASGSWDGPYTGERFTDPGDLDIDHMVPLANAHRSGRVGLERGQEARVRERSVVRGAPDSGEGVGEPCEG